MYRIRNPDLLDLDNTILKMASKRAEVDATLSLPGVSGVFTQDIDQYPDALTDEPRKRVDAEAKAVEPQKSEATAKPSEKEPRLNPKAVEAEEAVKAALEANGLPTEGFMITVYGSSIRVQPPQDISQDTWNDYDKVLGYLQGRWSREGSRWEVPRP